MTQKYSTNSNAATILGLVAVFLVLVMLGFFGSVQRAPAAEEAACRTVEQLYTDAAKNGITTVTYEGVKADQVWEALTAIYGDPPWTNKTFIVVALADTLAWPQFFDVVSKCYIGELPIMDRAQWEMILEKGFGGRRAD